MERIVFHFALFIGPDLAVPFSWVLLNIALAPFLHNPIPCLSALRGDAGCVLQSHSVHGLQQSSTEDNVGHQRAWNFRLRAASERKQHHK
jgi:hypothetical protein